MEVGMSSPWVIAAPEYVAAAASDLENIRSSLSTANMAALAPTSGVLAAGGDEVSAMVAALFSSHAQAYQALSAQAASFHAQFVQLMNTGASRYALTEAANASPLLETLGQDATGAVNSVQALTGSPLAGGGAGAAIYGGNTGDRGSLFGSGSSGSSDAKVTPATSVPSGGVTALTGNGAASAPNYAAAGGIGGSGINGGLLPFGAAAVANPIAAGNGAPVGAGGSGGLLSSDVAVDADGGTASAPVASPLLKPIGTSGPTAAPLPGSAGVSENGGNGGAGRLGAEASTVGGQEGSGSEARTSGDAGGGGGATGTIGELREGQRMGLSFYGSGSQGGDGTETGAAAGAAISS
jgi:hypothetical protein